MGAAAMSAVDHIRVNRIRNSLLVCPLSDRARAMLDQIATRSLPPILICTFFRSDCDLFGSDPMRATEEFEGPFQELDDRGLVAIDSIVAEHGPEVDSGWWYWVTLRLAWDLPERGEGLLA